MIEKKSYNPSEAALAVKMSIWTIYRMLKNNELEHAHTHKKTHHNARIPKSEIMRLSGSIEFVEKELCIRRKAICGVYVLRSPSTNLYKLGRTKNLKLRISTYLGLVAEEMEITAFCRTADYIKIEQQIHELFFKKRVKKEWFHLSDADIKLLISDHKFALIEKPLSLFQRGIKAEFVDE